MDSKDFALGTPVKCDITNFRGIATGKCIYINGCVQYLVKPEVDKDGKMLDGEWIDSQQLSESDHCSHVDIKASKTGGPMEAPSVR